jgi:serine phosphatase RsbU (regulator of sigma subunit)
VTNANATSEKTEPPTGVTSRAPTGPRFRLLLALVVALLIVAVVGAATGTSAFVLDRAARETLRADLGAAERVFAESWAYRRSVLRSEARVIAEEPRLKAVTSAEDVGRDTIVGVALELHQAVASDLFVLTDAKGRLILDAADPSQSEHDLSAHEVIRDALSRGDASGVWTSGQTVYQVQARRLEFGETPFGVLVIGYVLGEKLVDSLERQLGAHAVLELDGLPIVASGGLDRGTLRGPLSAMPSGAVQELQVGSVRYLGVTAGLPGYTGQRKVRYALLRSLDAALEPSLRLRRLLVMIAGGALLLAFVGTGLLSGMLSRPLEELVGLTKRFAAGQLSARAKPAGPREMRILAESLNQMAADLEQTQRSLRQKDCLERELEIAERIQTALLPNVSHISKLEVAGRMVPATVVGGDYYDIHPAPGGAWIGVGDVAGHGLTAGLIMLMVQSGTASLVRALPNARPSQLVTLLNDVVFANVNQRLGESEHVTYALLRYYEDGRIVHAGAHEDMIVYRKGEKRCDVLRTSGMWLGALSGIEQMTSDSEFRIAAGDVLVLYSDGIIESMNAEREMYGVERVVAKLVEVADQPVDTICTAILDDVVAHTSVQDDDRTIVVLRQL